ncbi:sporangiospore maturation cell wall hydrolase GsmA [Pilimelia terevasa]|nr:sporangiospore maturation cell wall hydrolase GsmA [Pilimelia terevasa]
MVTVLVGAATLVVAAPPAGAVVRRTATLHTTGAYVYVRNGPTSTNRIVAAVRQGTRLSVNCQVFGQGMAGRARTTGYWDKLTSGAYLSDAYVRWYPNRSVPWCSASGHRAVAAVYSRTATVTVHRGPDTRYAVVGRLSNRQRFGVACQQWGQRVQGPRTSSPIWNVLATGRQVPDALTLWRPGRPALPWCGQSPWSGPVSQSTFIRRVAPGAQAGQRAYRVPASVTIAQAILESGWGSSGLTRRDHNYFGIKCFGNPGQVAVGCRSYATHECGGGRCWKTRASFRVYRNLNGSMVDHGRWLAERPRYAGAFRYRLSPERFAMAIHRAGYATSPVYAANLIRIMRRYHLYRFNR